MPLLLTAFLGILLRLTELGFIMGHWYDRDGNSRHTIVGKNGRERPTTLADGRRHNLYPSVTSVMDIQGKPALVQWLQNQLLLAAIETPYDSSWCPDRWKKHVIGKSRKIGEDAAKRGNEIHDSMEKFFTNGAFDTNKDYTLQAATEISVKFPGYSWVPEASFAHEEGFGGRVDLHGHDDKGNYVIIDFKTKDKNDVKDFVQYDDHRIQLAAYQVGLRLPDDTRRFNLFISVHKDTPGLCKLVECREFDRYRDIFYTLVRLWQLRNKYKPGE